MPDIDEAVARGLKAHLARHAAARRFGYKVAFNTTAVQQRLGLAGSLVAGLTRDTLESAGVPHSLAGGTRIALEAEVAVRLAADVPPDAAPGAVAAAVEWWAPAIEIVDFDRPLDELEAILEEGVFHRALRLGEPARPAPGANLAGIVARVDHAGRRLCEVDAREKTGHVPDVLLAVARVLAAHGARLAAGDVVILGSMNPPAFAEPDTRFALELSGVGGVAVDLVA